MDIKKPEMPNIRERNYGSGKKIYFLDYFDPWENKRKRLVVGSRIAYARQKASQLYSEMMDRWTGVPTIVNSDISIDSLLNSFFMFKENRSRQSTIVRYRIYERHFIKFMAESFPKVENVSGIKKAYLEEHLAEMFRKGKAPQTVNGQLKFLRAIFNFAVDEGYIRDNPARKIKYFPLPKDNSVEYWTKAEVDLILDNVNHHFKDHFKFIYHTGMRKGELLNLTWEDVNLRGENSSIIIQAKDGWSTKTNTKRVIPLNSEAIAILKRQKKQSNHNYVFSAVRGGKIHKNQLYDVLQKTLKKLRLDGDIHKFRHTFASHLVMKGVGFETVSKLLGHSSVETTQRYAHLAPDHLFTAINKLTQDVNKASAQIVKPQPAMLANPDTKNKP